MRKIKGEKSKSHSYRGELFSAKAFEADELERTTSLVGLNESRETQMKKDASACLETEEGLSADGSRLTF